MKVMFSSFLFVVVVLVDCSFGVVEALALSAFAVST